jgi:hypothetical protein
MLLPVDTWDMILWVTVLLVQSLPYFSAFCLSIISAFPNSQLYQNDRDDSLSESTAMEQPDAVPPNA